MHVSALILRQFRSHNSLELNPDPGVNLFLGENGAGKTNIIEALAVLATGESPRMADMESLVQWDMNGFYVSGLFHLDDAEAAPLKLEMKYKIGSVRSVRENGETTVRLRDLLGRVPLVCFVPEDLSLVKGEPEQRRRAVDFLLMQIDSAYAKEARLYTDVLRSRNAALRQMSDGLLNEQALEPWTESLINAGLPLIEKRARFIEEFSKRFADVHARVSGNGERAAIVYKPSVLGPWDEQAKNRWRAELRRLRDKELALGSTAVGPQRDDVTFLVNDRPAKSFSSEGQKRTCAVSFKLAQIPLLHERVGLKPICLLDDVLSELDANRAEHLLDEMSKTGQCFVTMTGLESWPRSKDLPAAIFRVDKEGIRRDQSLLVMGATDF